MKETYEYLKKLEVNYVATIKEDKPSCRPFGDPILFEDKIYVITNKEKEVYKQVKENNNVCIVAYNNETWIRINCKLIDDSNNIGAKQEVINKFDWAKEAGYTLENPNFAVLYIADADVTIYDDAKIVATYQF